MTRFQRTVPLWFGLLLFASATGAGGAFSDLIVFGDSLSDVGNVRAKSFGLAAAAPYVDGRLTNGPNYVDYLAPRLGLGSPNYSAAGGRNYAHGGATVRLGGNLFIDALTTQKSDYLSSVSGTADPQALYVVLGGGNDVRDLTVDVVGAATDLVGIVGELLAAGAEKIVVPNLPDLGLTPEVTEFGQGAGAASTTRTLQFNDQLAVGLDALGAGERVVPFDLFGLLHEIVADAAAGGTQFGITNVVDDCWQGGTAGFGFGDPLFGSYPQCAHPEDYLFWDIVHPTTVAHEYFAERVYQTLMADASSGDFNDDGIYDCADVDGLVAVIVAGTDPAAYDLTGDGLVDDADLQAWLAEAGAANLGSGTTYLSGDANLDGLVDTSDFNLWNGSKFQATQSWCRGDFNADGVSDISDFNIWNLNKFRAAGTGMVPEPAGPGAALGAAILLWAFRRCR